MKKNVPLVCFAGLLSDTNLGDVVILESTEGLYTLALANGENKILSIRLDLQYQEINFLRRGIRKYKRIFIRKFKLDSDRFEIDALKKHYQKQLDNAELIVVVGGGLIKYKYQSFHLFLAALIEYAEEKQIPLVINAAGVEGYDEDDSRCQLLKNALNKKIVKSITTRDDLKTLEENYITQDTAKHVGKVSDPAVYCDEIYGVSKKASDVFGIGLVRGGIFLDNERNFKPDNVADFYANLITEMEKRNLKYQLFTNGLSTDSELVSQIEARLNNRKLNVLEPKEAKELIQIISSFTTVIAARLHANIISYSLDIPSVGLVWNDKLALFGNDIGYPERFFEYSDFDAKKIVDAAVLANEQGYDQQNRAKYRQTAKENISGIVTQWLKGEL